MHYTENKAGIKIASLDAEKAFDRVWRDGFFYKLIDKLSPTLWTILKIYYDSAKGCIELSDEIFSDLFSINIGVKQGGILSPSLFHVYIDELIHNSTNANIGAIFNKLNVSIIMYADDIILMSSVDSRLQKLLDICEEYSQRWLIKFNASKSCIVEFGPQIFNNSTFKINNLAISIKKDFKYLSNIELKPRWLYAGNTVSFLGPFKNSSHILFTIPNM